MAEEAALAEESALAALREVEEKATMEELDRVKTELERDRREAEAELRGHLHVGLVCFLRACRLLWFFQAETSATLCVMSV